MDKVEYGYDHAAYVIDNLDDNSDASMEFIVTVEISILIAAGYTTWDSIDELMKKILSELSMMEISVKEKNGTPKDKNGKTKQKFRTRPITFDKILLVYHNRNIDGSILVNPHFHVIGDSKSRVGRGYSYLRQAFQKLAALYNIQFHFMAETRETGLSKKQGKVIDTMATILQRGTLDEKVKYLEDDKIYTSLELLEVHYSNSHNLSYFLKQMSILNKSLRDIDLDLEYKDVNLKNEIFFYLTRTQMQKLISLKSEEKIHLDLDEILEREILKSAYGFESITMKILKEMFDIEEISKDNITFSRPSKSISKKEKATKNSDFYDFIHQDIHNALSVSTSLYNFKEMMLKMEYNNIKVKRKNINKNTRKKTGFELKTKKNYYVQIGFRQLGLSWESILKIFENNIRRRKKEKIIESQLKNYRRKIKDQEELNNMFVYTVNDIFKIKFGKDYNFNTVSKPFLEGFKVQSSLMYNITTYQTDDIIIVEYPDSLEIKKCNNVTLGIDIISQFFPENISIGKLDIMYDGYKEFVSIFEKKMKKSMINQKESKKIDLERLKFQSNQ